MNENWYKICRERSVDFQKICWSHKNQHQLKLPRKATMYALRLDWNCILRFPRLSEKEHGETYGDGDYNSVRFYWSSPMSGACTFHTRARTRGNARTHSSFSFPIRAAGVRFHEGRIPRNQALAPNGFRTVHIDCGCTVVSTTRQQIGERLVMLLHIVYQNFMIIITRHMKFLYLHFRRWYWRIFQTHK